MQTYIKDYIKDLSGHKSCCHTVSMSEMFESFLSPSLVQGTKRSLLYSSKIRRVGRVIQNRHATLTQELPF